MPADSIKCAHGLLPTACALCEPAATEALEQEVAELRGLLDAQAKLLAELPPSADALLLAQMEAATARAESERLAAELANPVRTGVCETCIEGTIHENARLREALRDIRDNYDCDEDAHRYNTGCRCCIANAALSTAPKQEPCDMCDGDHVVLVGDEEHADTVPCPACTDTCTACCATPCACTPASVENECMGGGWTYDRAKNEWECVQCGVIKPGGAIDVEIDNPHIRPAPVEAQQEVAEPTIDHAACLDYSATYCAERVKAQEWAKCQRCDLANEAQAECMAGPDDACPTHEIECIDCKYSAGKPREAQEHPHTELLCEAAKLLSDNLSFDDERQALAGRIRAALATKGGE